jgi:D-alanine-D-alanine ligase-like ATP-grasp enzyme
MVVIDFKVSAAAVRRPPRVAGTGLHTVAQLIDAESRRRSAATRGASAIPLDGETTRCVREAGHEFDSVLPAGAEIILRGAANVHTGGTIEDVTSEVSSALIATAQRAARILDIPVVGIDMIVPSIAGGRSWILEANERPGFANHEPEPVAERFLDFLFPES